MHLVISLGCFQSFSDEIDIPFARPDAGRRFLLERVEDIQLDTRFRRATR